MAELRITSSNAVRNIVANQLGLSDEEAEKLSVKLMRTVFLNDKSLVMNTLEWVVYTNQGPKTISPTACFSNRDCRIIFEYEIKPDSVEKEIILTDYQMVPTLTKKGGQDVLTYEPVLHKNVSYAHLKIINKGTPKEDMILEEC